MHSPWVLFFLLPAAVCALGFWAFLTEAASEHRAQAGRMLPDRTVFLRAFGAATTCCAAALVCLAPIALYALNSGIARSLTP